MEIPEGWKLVPIEPTPEMVDGLIEFAKEYYDHELGQGIAHSLILNAIQNAPDYRDALIEKLTEALNAALDAMEHTGDALNDIDAVGPEDEKHFPAFELARKAITAAKAVRHNA